MSKTRIQLKRRVMVGRRVYQVDEVVEAGDNLITLLTKVRGSFIVLGPVSETLIEEVDEEDDEKEESAGLESLKVAELKDLAAKHEIDVNGLKKAEIVDRLQEKVTDILSDT